MALEVLPRWEMIRELSYFRKSGTLTAQFGKNYLYWTIRHGDVICFSSTSADYSFTRFLYENSSMEQEKITWAQSLISETRCLGLAVVQKNFLEPDTLRELLKQHCFAHAHFLMETSTHLFYSPRVTQLKPQMVQLELSLSEVLLQSERNSLEIRSAVEFAEQVLGTYRVCEFEIVERALKVEERRMLRYLKNSSSLAEILSDPELDRLTCYRVLFLLWVAGYIQEIHPKPEKEETTTQEKLLALLRTVPTEWIIPFAIGLLVGVLFAPSPAPDPTASNPCKSAPAIPPPWSSNR
jgi:Domain of unknown function (DUF4388)